MRYSSRVKVKLIEDNSGSYKEIPTIITDEGPIINVTNFLLHLSSNGASLSTLNGYIRAIMLLIEYIEANRGLFKEPAQLFSAFVTRIQDGTFGPDGIDPSGLCWLPQSQKTVNLYIARLSHFSDWMADRGLGRRLNPFRKATTQEERLAYAAWLHRNNNDFLGHIRNQSITTEKKLSRTIRGKYKWQGTSRPAIPFPESKFRDFFEYGIGAAKDPRVALRDKLILLLIHGSGLRISEALLPWITDIQPDPTDPQSAIVLVYNEHEGNTPDYFKSQGVKKRAACLQKEFGRKPRVDMIGKEHLGFKSRILEEGQYLRAYFFPPDTGIYSCNFGEST